MVEQEFKKLTLITKETDPTHHQATVTNVAGVEGLAMVKPPVMRSGRTSVRPLVNAAKSATSLDILPQNVELKMEITRIAKPILLRMRVMMRKSLTFIT